jgi:hypothetical protein
MKNIVFALMIILGFASLSTAGECANGTCTVAQPRRVVTVTKNVVRETVRLPRRFVNSVCTNGSCYSRSVTRVR